MPCALSESSPACPAARRPPTPFSIPAENGPEYSECARHVLAAKPRKGNAVIFHSANLEGSLEKLSFHEACPVIRGVKCGCRPAAAAAGGALAASQAPASYAHAGPPLPLGRADAGLGADTAHESARAPKPLKRCAVLRCAALCAAPGSAPKWIHFRHFRAGDEPVMWEKKRSVNQMAPDGSGARAGQRCEVLPLLLLGSGLLALLLPVWLLLRLLLRLPRLVPARLALLLACCSLQGLPAGALKAACPACPACLPPCRPAALLSTAERCPACPACPAAECRDLHEFCSSWAQNGECSKNAEFMLGTEFHPGKCLKSCNRCAARSGGRACQAEISCWRPCCCTAAVAVATATAMWHGASRPPRSWPTVGTMLSGGRSRTL